MDGYDQPDHGAEAFYAAAAGFAKNNHLSLGPRILRLGKTPVDQPVKTHAPAYTPPSVPPPTASVPTPRQYAPPPPDVVPTQVPAGLPTAKPYAPRTGPNKYE